jgi:hypothetical protein
MKHLKHDKKTLIMDAVTGVVDLDKLQDSKILSTVLYRCLHLYYRELGEEGLENVLRMWDDISKLSQK